jgi:photosystem II stability/assembly factor-like uncharacterized protein
MRRSFVYAGVTRWRGGGSDAPADESLGGVFRMTVGDGQWEHLRSGLPEECHVHCVTVHPANTDILYAGTHDGPYCSTNRGDDWQRLGFPERTQVWSIAVHPNKPDTLFAGTSPIGVWRSDDGGKSWQRCQVPVSDRLEMGNFRNRVMRIAIDPQYPSEIYAAMEVNGIMRSYDGGENWTDSSADLVRLGEQPKLESAILTSSKSEGMLDAHALCTTQAKPRSVFLAVRMGLFQSNDRAVNWGDLDVGRYSPMTYGRDIRVSPHDPNVLYACLSVASNGDTGAIYRSPDLGKTWTRFDHSIHAESTMMAVATNPGDPSVVYGASRHGQVFGTEDSGETWKEYRLPRGCVGVYAIAIN